MSWRVRVARLLLDRSQWYSPARLRRLQARRLRPLILHAYAQCPYYRRTIAARGVDPRQIRTLDDLDLLPVIAREEMMRHGAEITARNADRYQPASDTTGGTTGAPLQFLVDHDTVSMARAVRLRFMGWHGVRPGDRLVEFRRPASFRLPSGDADTQTISRYFPHQNLLRFNVKAIGTARFSEVAEEAGRFRPAAIRGNVSVLLTFSRYLLENRRFEIRPRALFVGGERLFPEQRQIMAEAFGAPVVETYGNREHALLGGECERGRLHLAAELSVFETLTEGRPSPPGELGELVVTNLWNHSFPFLRYAIGDVAAATPDLCPCGRSLPTARVLGGKVLNLLATPTGFVFMSNSVVATARWRDKIAGIRFYQEKRDEVTVQVVRGPAYGGDDEQALVAEMDHLFGGALKIGVQYFESLEETPGGKYIYIVSKVPLSL